MNKDNFQEEVWSKGFGKEYAKRNISDTKLEDKLYLRDYGVTRTKLNEEFVSKLNRSIKILEVGS